MTQKKRIRPPFLKVIATPEEAADIRYRASCARLPVSAYPRTLGLACKVNPPPATRRLAWRGRAGVQIHL